MAELANTSKCSVSRGDKTKLYQDVPEELKNEGLLKGRNGELKKFRKNETSIEEGTKDHQ
jgi:hypothetical protein